MPPSGPIEPPRISKGERGPNETHQVICSECGAPFLARNKAAKTCKTACRMKRKRRIDRGDTRDLVVEASSTIAAVDQARQQALDDLPAVAREVLAEELRPVVREALTSKVLESIGDMVDLVPLAQAALKEDLVAADVMLDRDGEIVRDKDGDPVFTVDHDRRQRAIGMVMKYSIGQPGLAPQAETAESGNVTVVFGGMPALGAVVDAEGSAIEDAVELNPGERQCDVCLQPKPAGEFVGQSSRCAVCHVEARERVEAAIAERTKPAT